MMIVSVLLFTYRDATRISRCAFLNFKCAKMAAFAFVSTALVRNSWHLLSCLPERPTARLYERSASDADEGLSIGKKGSIFDSLYEFTTTLQLSSRLLGSPLNSQPRVPIQDSVSCLEVMIRIMPSIRLLPVSKILDHYRSRL
jgi:hypothetical protein